MRAFIVGLSLWLVVASHSWATEPDTELLEGTLLAYEQACQVVVPFEVRLTTTIISFAGEHAGEPRRVRETRHIYDSAKYRVDELSGFRGTFSPGEHCTVWDGEESRSFFAKSLSGKRESYLSTMPTSQGPAYTNFFMTFDGSRYRYVDLLRERMALSRVTATRDSAGRIILETPPVASPPMVFGGIGVKLVLNPQQGHMPVSIDYLLVNDAGDEPLFWTSLENTLEEVAPGCWLPVKTIMTMYGIVPDSDGYQEPVGQQIQEVDTANSRFNASLNDALFALEYPAGTTVWDKVNRVRYRVTEDQREEVLETLRPFSVHSVNTIGSGECVKCKRKDY